MRLIKIGYANIDTTVGDFSGNTDKVIAHAKRMIAENCTIGAFQEQVIGGYPGEDLVQWQAFVERQWEQLGRFCRETMNASPNGPSRSTTVFMVGLTVGIGGDLYNSVAVVCGGKIHGIVPKEKLPTYGVFYEARTFSKGIPGTRIMLPSDDEVSLDAVPFGDLVFDTDFGRCGVEICEDIWSPDGPMRRRCYAGAELMINSSASPFRQGVVQTRREMLATRSADNQCTVVYVNQVGANDALVFDGGTLIYQNGRTIAESSRWTERSGAEIVDLDRTRRMRRENTTWRSDKEDYVRRGEKPCHVVAIIGTAKPNHPQFAYPVPTKTAAPAQRSFFLPETAGVAQTPREAFMEDMVMATVTGLGYLLKTKAFTCIGVSLSGGKDSVLTAALARIFVTKNIAWVEEQTGLEGEAAAAAYLRFFSQPTRFNSDATKSLAERVAKQLGAAFMEESIEEAFGREVEATRRMLGGKELTPVTLQNIQARIRGQRMWNWANTSGGFWLQTGNMSEKATGYTTVGGDMMGAFSLIANMPKTVIIELLRYMGREYEIPTLIEVADSEASAELSEGQSDEADLMPFPVLDACFALFAGEKMTADEVLLVLRQMWTDDELLGMAPRYRPGMLEVWVDRFVKLFFRNIFKWVMTPQSVHLGSLDLDRERALQLPVVQDCRWAERKPSTT